MCCISREAGAGSDYGQDDRYFARGRTPAAIMVRMTGRKLLGLCSRLDSTDSVHGIVLHSKLILIFKAQPKIENGAGFINADSLKR
jgi:hypothetical protein